jgi:hypothetical protein
MNWKTINSILARAVVDETFCQNLLEDPSTAIQQQQFVLTKEEEEKLNVIEARDLSEFSQQILVHFGQLADQKICQVLQAMRAYLAEGTTPFPGSCITLL